MHDQANLTPAQQAMADCWDQHTRSEFTTKSLDETLATMAAEPYVNHMPVMTGGYGLVNVRNFYGKYFIPGQPPDTEVATISRTIGENRLVDELIHKFTHTVEMPWILPGIRPTGRRVELAVVVVAEFRDGKIAGEHIYWDQASLLVQVGLLDARHLPVCGVEATRKLVDPSIPSNRLIERAESV